MIPAELLKRHNKLDTKRQMELVAILEKLREEQRAAKRAEAATT